MLADYMQNLKEAIEKKDSKAQNKILKELQRLGMDAQTALFLVHENNIACNKKN